MAREFEIYNGARVSAPEVRLQAPEGVPASPLHGQAVDAAIGAGLEVVHQYAKLKDFGTQQELRRKRAASEAAMDEEWRKKSALAWGSEGSFFFEDGSLNEDELNAFVGKWQEEDVKNRASSRFWTREAAMKEDATSAEVQQGVAIEGMRRALAAEQANRKQLFEDNYQLAVAKDDWGTACAVVDEAVAGGQITRPRGEYLKLRVGKAALRRRGGVRVGGADYEGLDAAYAAAAANSGYKVDEGEKGMAKEPVDDITLRGMPEEVSLKGTDGMEVEVATPGVAKDYTLDAERMLEATAERSVGDEWLKMGDFSEVLKGLEPQELGELTGLWDEGMAVNVQEPQVAGERAVYTAGAGAPDAVELVAASGNVEGVPSREAVEAMVVGVILGELGRDSGLSEGDLVKVFDKSGAYRVMGNGDEEVGKNVIGGMAREAKARSSAGRERLSVEDIKAMVDLQVKGEGFGEGEEWRVMEGLNPGVGKGEVYRYPEGDAVGEKRWVELKKVYMKHRGEYNPAMAGKGMTDEEFAEKAQGFWDWYMGGSNRHKDAKAASVASGKDWYRAAVLQRLMEIRDSGQEVGYADELQAARDVLGERCPLAPAVERMLADKLELSRRADEQNKKRMDGKEMYYEELRRMKGYEKEHNEKAEAERKRAEDRQRRADKKAEEDAEKAAEKREGLRRRVALQMPRMGGWRWNGKPTAGERTPMCRVPRGEYERLVELGYDGTQLVFMKVGGKQVLVDMSEPAGGAELELNAPACEFMQPQKPRGKRQVPKVLRGGTDYSFIFKN